jgi:hypothetical protein
LKVGLSEEDLSLKQSVIFEFKTLKIKVFTQAMSNQNLLNDEDIENFLRILQKGELKEALQFLYNKSSMINQDARLDMALRCAKNEFLKKVNRQSRYAAEDDEIYAYLITIFNKYKSVSFTDSDFNEYICPIFNGLSQLQREIWTFKFPNNLNVQKYAADKIKTEQALINKPIMTTKLGEENWMNIFARFYRIINIGYDKLGVPESVKYPNGSYLTGPKFFSLLKELLPFYPSYEIVVKKARIKGVSTSREKLFSDVFDGFDEVERIEIYDFFLDRLEKAPEFEVKELKDALNGADVSFRLKPLVNVQGEDSHLKKIFISYSWDSEEHKRWVKKLAEKLEQHFDVRYDAVLISPGTNITHKISSELKQADYVLLICTEGYKSKAEDRVGGVGFEYIHIVNDLYNDQTNSKGKYITVLRGANRKYSIPDFLQAFAHENLHEDLMFDEKVDLLINNLTNPKDKG